LKISAKQAKQLLLTVAFAGFLRGQTVDDGIIIPRHTLFTGDTWTYDTWNHYWEGHLYRTNGNLGTVTTQSNNWYADYGITNRLDFIANVPYVWTNASQGVLRGMEGFQDVTLAGKFVFLKRPFTSKGSLSAIAVASGTIPLTNYEPSFEPLSIGNHSKTISARTTLFWQSDSVWAATASAAYTWRSNIALDQQYYYTDNQFYLTNQVVMPQVFNYNVNYGYMHRGRMLFVDWSQQRTQGGGDIRRQDMPFPSNMVNYSKVGLTTMYPLPIHFLHDLGVQFNFGYIVDGRNIGRSMTFTTGLLYTVHFPGSPRDTK
jgi:hypothetical protein